MFDFLQVYLSKLAVTASEHEDECLIWATLWLTFDTQDDDEYYLPNEDEAQSEHLQLVMLADRNDPEVVKRIANLEKKFAILEKEEEDDGGALESKKKKSTGDEEEKKEKESLLSSINRKSPKCRMSKRDRKKCASPYDDESSTK